ncbi:MAG: 16S rRNA (cytidine(1402)-2'-O)-methyltransferase, partial [Acutalibacteraceae bacterium]
MLENEQFGTLYIVATPIGNSRDMSQRGIDILTSVDIIAAEDTRRSMILLNKLEIKNKLVSNHKFNEYGKSKYFINEMKSGKSVAVITDAGTPCISDPGNELIKAAVEEGIRVVGIPGCCAAVTALSISGFDLSSFLFYGFFPRENSERRKLLEEMRKGVGTRTFAFYESPKRIMDTVEFFIESEALCQMCLCNDMTKLHEMTFRGTP